MPLPTSVSVAPRRFGEATQIIDRSAVGLNHFAQRPRLQARGTDPLTGPLTARLTFPWVQ
jgi:hypothetical protein